MKRQHQSNHFDDKPRSILGYVSYREFLRDFVQSKKNGSKAWSFTVWARQLGLKSSSTLIMLCTGSRAPGPKLMSKLETYFNFSQRESSHFKDLVKLDKLNRRFDASASELQSSIDSDPRLGMLLLKEQSFRVVSEWQYYAIREMTRLKGFRSDPRWIKSNLDSKLSKSEIQQILRTLVAMGLIERTQDGCLQYREQHVGTRDDQVDMALRSYHNELLRIARDKTESTELWEREISGGCFALASKDLPAAKKMIRRFQREFCEAFETSDADSVYQLEVAFFPLTKSKGPKDVETFQQH